MINILRLFRFIFGYCYSCGEYFKYPKLYRENTLYEPEEKNWHRECEECFEEHEVYWQERWDEYNAERL